MSVVSERPYVTSRFVFEVDGMEIGTFTEVSGLRVEVEVQELAEGGENQYVHKLPGRMKWPNIVLKRGMTRSANLFSWLQTSSGESFAGKGNKLERNTAAVTLIDQRGKRMRSFELLDAFAVRWEGPKLAAGSPEVAEEELEIAHHGFRVTGS